MSEKTVHDQCMIGDVWLQLCIEKSEIPVYCVRYRAILPIFDSIIGCFFWKYVAIGLTHENVAIKTYNEYKDDLLENHNYNLSKK